jgi:Flp pilus assembly protein TadG
VSKKTIPNVRKRGTAGSAVVELTLLVPWFLFLFVFTVDLGFYNYALISVENAARIGAEYTSQSTSTAADASGACTKILAELKMLPNISSTLTTCDALPVIVTAVSKAGTDGSAASEVSVTYQGLQMIPIPGFLMGRMTFKRITQMRVAS